MLMAIAKEKKPTETQKNTKEQKSCARYLRRLLDPKSEIFDKEFKKAILATNPDWAFNNSIKEQKEELISLAKLKQDKPKDKRLLKNLNKFMNPSSSYFDEKFAKIIVNINNKWEVKSKLSTQQKKEALLKRAREGKPRPKFNAKDNKERELAFALRRYLTIGSPCYDPSFKRKILKIRPTWMPKKQKNKKQLSVINKPIPSYQHILLENTTVFINNK